MIANLVDNGIRYNEPGGFLDVRTRSAAGRVRVVVANGGGRIDPEDAKTLIEPFRRLDRAGGGFGLGLSIVRSVAEAHGGRAEIRAPESGGLEVTIDLPAHPTPPKPSPKTGANVGVAQTSRALTGS
jgi:signal transduction histidine kinase